MIDPRSPRQAVLGVIPKLRHPRHPLDTAPKGVETHPGDGRLSVGNASLRLSHIYHAWSSSVCPSRRSLSDKEPSDRTESSTDTRRSVLLIESSTPRRLHHHISDPDASSIPIAELSGSDRVVRPDRQKLESSFEKYGLSRREVNRTIARPPFCKHLPPRVQALRSKNRLVLIAEINNPRSHACRQHFRTAVQVEA